MSSQPGVSYLCWLSSEGGSVCVEAGVVDHPACHHNQGCLTSVGCQVRVALFASRLATQHLICLGFSSLCGLGQGNPQLDSLYNFACFHKMLCKLAKLGEKSLGQCSCSLATDEVFLHTYNS